MNFENTNMAQVATGVYMQTQTAEDSLLVIVETSSASEHSHSDNTTASIQSSSQHAQVLDQTQIYLNHLCSHGYDEIEQIGEGSFGSVFKAKHVASGQDVAVKVIHNIGADHYRRRQLISEIQIMRKLTAIQSNVFTTKLLDVLIPESLE